MAEKSPERRLTEFIRRFSPEVARTARSARTKVHNLLPDAFELVYDNYNALAWISTGESLPNIEGSRVLRWSSVARDHSTTGP